MSIRHDIAAGLREALPSTWRVWDHVPALDRIDRQTVVIHGSAQRPTRGAPRAYRDLDFTVTLVEPNLDPAKAEDALDADSEALIDALESLAQPGLLWTEATRVSFQDMPAIDVTVTVTTEKE